MKVWLRSGVFCVVVITTSGCGGGRQDVLPKSISTTEAETLLPVPQASTAVPNGPLSVFDGSSDTRRLLESAVDREIGTCMVALGFTYDGGAGAEHPTTPRPFWEANFGLLDLVNAQQNGYHVPDFIETEMRSPPTDANYIAALQGAESGSVMEVRDTLTGAELGGFEVHQGCIGRAQDALYGSTDQLLRYVALRATLEQRAFDLLERVRSSPQFIELSQSWSDCMQRSGYAFGSPFEPASFPWTEGRLSDVERQTAIADVTCKSHLGYREQVEALVQTEVVADDSSTAAAFDEFTQVVAGLADRARQLLTG